MVSQTCFIRCKEKCGSITNFHIHVRMNIRNCVLIRNLLIYVHCVMCEQDEKDRGPLFCSVCNPHRPVSKYTFGRILKCLSYELFDTYDIHCLTCHSMRNFGYVLSCWGDGNSRALESTVGAGSGKVP